MEKQEDTVNKVDILDKIYEIRQEDFEAESSKDREYLSQILNEVKVEKIEEKINEVLNKEEAKNITKKIELLVENYEIQIAYYSKKIINKVLKMLFAYTHNVWKVIMKVIKKMMMQVNKKEIMQVNKKMIKINK